MLRPRNLSKNRFNELPEEITEFLFLERLQCHHNAIRQIPDTVSNLQCLNYLDLSRNHLTVLPKEICQLPIQFIDQVGHFKILLVSNNRLACLPDELGRMSQLTELDASGNQLTHLPPRMGDLQNLKSLVVRSNLLLCVPLEITYLNLTRLDLRANRISTLPVEMINITSLVELFIEDNPLTSPPASLCKRGRIHIFKYLETEVIKLERKTGISGNNTLSRKSRRSSGTSGPPAHLPERLRQKRHNVDSGYSTSDGLDKRWSQEIAPDTEKHWTSSPILSRAYELNGTNSPNSTPSTISPAPDTTIDDDLSSKSLFNDFDRREDSKTVRDSNSFDTTLVNGMEDKSRPLTQIQTYKEYKEALRQQRAQDVPSIYRTREHDDHNYKTEPNTPTHHMSPSRSALATSKSDPTPLNSVLSSPKHVFDDTSPRKPVLKVSPSKNHANYLQSNGNTMNGTNKYMQDYIKPKSPLKNSTGIMVHNNVPPTETTAVTFINGKPSSPRIANTISYFNGAAKGANGLKTNRSVSWNESVPTEKISFTMRREIDKAKEESEMIDQLRNIIEARLKMALPDDLSSALTDGVVLCHLANNIRPRSVASIHVPSPAVPKLTMARCRRNVDNFIEACRRIGVDEHLVCCSSDVLEGRGLVQIAITVAELIRFHPNNKSPLHANMH
ncbi:hypothetical protein PPYR_10783 [Photinus pyralis]|uniref:Calponin-homology (CH) domain-containing protein n=1 Tax=Photinus pyralis TaxID=7054 RepID=A0A5N4AH98_PHOPY|nr:hypothetical protein PPYR_10783 [Photinus pyralis]